MDRNTASTKYQDEPAGEASVPPAQALVAVTIATELAAMDSAAYLYSLNKDM